jgi:hypothetical protein
LSQIFEALHLLWHRIFKQVQLHPISSVLLLKRLELLLEALSIFWRSGTDGNGGDFPRPHKCKGSTILMLSPPEILH